MENEEGADDQKSRPLARTVRGAPTEKGGQKWVKVPSHVDLEGDEHADKLADEGVRKHRVRLAADGKEKRQADKRPTEQQEQQETAGIAGVAKKRRVEGVPQQPNPNLPSLPLPPTQNPRPDGNPGTTLPDP